MEDESGFASCYRKLLNAFEMTPEASSKQLSAILMRVCGPPPQTPATQNGRMQP